MWAEQYADPPIAAALGRRVVMELSRINLQQGDGKIKARRKKD